MNNRISFYALMYALEKSFGSGVSEFEETIRSKYRESTDHIRIAENEGMLYLSPYQWPLDRVQDPATVEDPEPIEGVDEETINSLKIDCENLRQMLYDSIAQNYKLIGSATELYVSNAVYIRTILQTDIQVIMAEHGLPMPVCLRGTELETKGGRFSPISYRPVGFVISLVPEKRLYVEDPVELST